MQLQTTKEAQRGQWRIEMTKTVQKSAQNPQNVTESEVFEGSIVESEGSVLIRGVKFL